MDEEALLKQFAAQFAHGPDDADDTDAAVAAQGADSTANQATDDADQSLSLIHISEPTRPY